MNNPTDKEFCDSLIQQLTSTIIGLNKIIKRFIAQKRVSFNHYDHTVTRDKEDSPYSDNSNINPQLIEKLFLKSEYIFLLNSTLKNSTTS